MDYNCVKFNVKDAVPMVPVGLVLVTDRALSVAILSPQKSVVVVFVHALDAYTTEELPTVYVPVKDPSEGSLANEVFVPT